MAGTNQFVPYASAAGANTLAPDAYAAAPARQAGQISGRASSTLSNTAWRQATTMASVIGQLITTQTSLNALDNGDIATLTNSLIAALQAVGGGNVTNILSSLSITGGRLAFFNSNGVWTAPAGVTLARAIGQAGGGGGGWGGGTAGAGGLGGNSFEGRFDVVPGTNYAATIGAGGIGGTNGAGSTGGITSFGALASAFGGTGGGAGNGSNPGLTGTPAGLTGISFPHGGYELRGGSAQDGIALSGVANIGGQGGGSRFSPNAPNPYGGGNFLASGYGGGGSGGAGTSAGANGGGGFLLIEY